MNDPSASAEESTFHIWKWLVLIVFVAFIGGLSTWPRFAQRWDRLEQKYEGRQQAAQQASEDLENQTIDPVQRTAPVGWVVVGFVLFLATPIGVLLVLNVRKHNTPSPNEEP